MNTTSLAIAIVVGLIIIILVSVGIWRCCCRAGGDSIEKSSESVIALASPAKSSVMAIQPTPLLPLPLRSGPYSAPLALVAYPPPTGIAYPSPPVVGAYSPAVVAPPLQIRSPPREAAPVRGAR